MLSPRSTICPRPTRSGSASPKSPIGSSWNSPARPTLRPEPPWARLADGMDSETPKTLRPALTQADIRQIFGGILLAMLLAALDQTIVATAMPTIGRDLHDVEHLPWIVTAYLLASTAVTPLYGK